jgi:hypothetical protein
VTEPRHDPEGSSSDAVLEFLSQHRQGTERGKQPSGRTRSSKALWLGVVAAIALIGGAALIWEVYASRPAASTAAPGGPTVNPKGTSHGTAANETRKTSAHAPATESWHRGLRSWARSTTDRHLPNFYYQWMHGGSTCAKYATYGCWKLKVVARHGCPHGVTMVVDETKGSSAVGVVWGFSRRLAAKKPGVIEVDADQNAVGGQVRSMICKT